MDKLRLEMIQHQSEHGVIDEIYYFINDRNLIDIVREIEIPLAKARTPLAHKDYILGIVVIMWV
jgi:hypothetical protein